MPVHMIYLDHAATTPLRPGVLEAMEPFAVAAYGNPSGVHAVSRQAKNALEEARERIAALIGAQPMEIVFTGGGTEADNLAIKGSSLSTSPVGGVVTTPTEHEAVLESAHFLERLGATVSMVEVDRHGKVDPEQIAATVEGGTAVVSVMAANNETGTLQPVAQVVEAVKARQPSLRVHTDAVQAFSTEEVEVDRWGVDLLSLAAHKFGGPKGVGVLYVRRGTELQPVIHGGGQELGRRSGTHNVAGAVGMAVAMELAKDDRKDFVTRVDAARSRFEQILAGSSVRTVPPVTALVQHSHLRFPGVSNETLLLNLDRTGVAASAGSACQSGAVTVSHVLAAIGLSTEQARSCVRFSFGWTTTTNEAEEAARLVLEALP